MKKFVDPEIKISLFAVEDVITASGGLEGDPNTGGDGGSAGRV